MSVDVRAPNSQAEQWWWRRLSLRARLTAAATAVIAVGMALAAVLLVWAVHSEMEGNLNDNLTRQARAVANDVTAGGTGARVQKTVDKSTVVQVVYDSGRVVTGGVSDGEPRLFFLSPGEDVPEIGDEAPYRVAALRAVPQRGQAATVYVASPITHLVDSTAELATALMFGVPAMVVLLALVGWWLLGRALRPVDTMQRQAAAIPATDLHRRLDVPDSHDELRRLAETFNDLLGRIEAAADRQRHFVADAAHELRTPLAALRTRLEIDLRHPRAGSSDPDDLHRREQALQQVTRLADLVNDLLQLARLDADPHLQRRPVDLDDLVWEAAREARDQGPPRIDTTGISPVRVLGDPMALRQVVRNLLDNARRHANQTIVVRLSTDTPAGEFATLTVADDGPGVAAIDRQRVFERFVRLDEGRARDTGGVGLGLAIVADIVAAHGGQVWIEDNQPGAQFHVQLPVAPA